MNEPAGLNEHFSVAGDAIDKLKVKAWRIMKNWIRLWTHIKANPYRDTLLLANFKKKMNTNCRRRRWITGGTLSLEKVDGISAVHGSTELTSCLTTWRQTRDTKRCDSLKMENNEKLRFAIKASGADMRDTRVRDDRF